MLVPRSLQSWVWRTGERDVARSVRKSTRLPKCGLMYGSHRMTFTVSLPYASEPCLFTRSRIRINDRRSLHSFKTSSRVRSFFVSGTATPIRSPSVASTLILSRWGISRRSVAGCAANPVLVSMYSPSFSIAACARDVRRERSGHRQQRAVHRRHLDLADCSSPMSRSHRRRRGLTSCGQAIEVFLTEARRQAKICRRMLYVS